MLSQTTTEFISRVLPFSSSILFLRLKLDLIYGTEVIIAHVRLILLIIHSLCILRFRSLWSNILIFIGLQRLYVILLNCKLLSSLFCSLFSHVIALKASLLLILFSIIIFIINTKYFIRMN